MGCRDPRRARGGGSRPLGRKDGMKLSAFSVPAIDRAAVVSTVRAHLGLGPPAAPAATKPPTGLVIYYRDPDGKPPIPSDPGGRRTGGTTARSRRARTSASMAIRRSPLRRCRTDAGGKRVLYYRNPMGLPDTSPVPKKDSMGTDHIPVHEGEDEESTITLSPGKLQRTGVRSETVERRVLITPVRAPRSARRGRSVGSRSCPCARRRSSRPSRTSRRAITCTRASPCSGSTLARHLCRRRANTCPRSA